MDATGIDHQAQDMAEAARVTSEHVIQALHAPGAAPGLPPGEAMRLLTDLKQDMADAVTACALAVTATELAHHAAVTATTLELEVLATSSAARDLAEASDKATRRPTT